MNSGTLKLTRAPQTAEEFSQWLREKPQAIEIKMSNVDLGAKLSAIGAALEAVRLAHRDEIGAQTWQDIQTAETAIAAAIFHRNDRRLTISR
jgi:hypothetical protein